MACLPRPVIIMIWSQPAARASSTPYWIMGLSTSGSISLGWALVAGRNRVPRPAAGRTALRTFIVVAGFRSLVLDTPGWMIVTARVGGRRMPPSYMFGVYRACVAGCGWYTGPRDN